MTRRREPGEYWGTSIPSMMLKQHNGFEIRMVWCNSRNSATLWGCNGDVGHKGERWPGVSPWPVEPVGQDRESLNRALRGTENGERKEVSRGELWSVLEGFCLSYFVIRIILLVACIINWVWGKSSKSRSRETTWEVRSVYLAQREILRW